MFILKKLSATFQCVHWPAGAEVSWSWLQQTLWQGEQDQTLLLFSCAVREEWKKKYFETKKATVSLEDTLNKLRQDLELYHQKLLLQLEARDSQKRPNNTTTSKVFAFIVYYLFLHNLRGFFCIKYKLKKQIYHQPMTCKLALAQWSEGQNSFSPSVSERLLKCLSLSICFCFLLVPFL